MVGSGQADGLLSENYIFWRIAMVENQSIRYKLLSTGLGDEKCHVNIAATKHFITPALLQPNIFEMYLGHIFFQNFEQGSAILD
jgi:hypothetical protein